MKPNIHPTYYTDAVVTCACGNTWTTGSTRKEIHTEVCSNCHPFFTGQQQRILDIEGQVDRFYKRLQARQDYVETTKARETVRTSPTRSIAELFPTSRWSWLISSIFWRKGAYTKQPRIRSPGKARGEREK